MLRVADANADKMNLPIRETITGVQFNIALGGPVTPVIPTVDRAPMMGVVFKRTEIENVGGLPATVAAEEFQLGRQALVYTTTRYDRWRLYKERFAGLFTPVLDAVLSGANVASLRLEYRDRFNYSGDPTAAKVSELLREGCELIAPHVFAQKHLWHSHTGMFLEADGAEHRLVQILIDANDITISVDQPPRRSVSVITGVQDFFQAEGLETKDQQASDLVARFEELHVASKDLFKGMLTEAAQKSVGLTD